MKDNPIYIRFEPAPNYERASPFHAIRKVGTGPGGSDQDCLIVATTRSGPPPSSTSMQGEGTFWIEFNSSKKPADMHRPNIQFGMQLLQRTFSGIRLLSMHGMNAEEQPINAIRLKEEIHRQHKCFCNTADGIIRWSVWQKPILNARIVALVQARATSDLRLAFSPVLPCERRQTRIKRACHLLTLFSFFRFCGQMRAHDLARRPRSGRWQLGWNEWQDRGRSGRLNARLIPPQNAPAVPRHHGNRFDSCLMSVQDVNDFNSR